METENPGKSKDTKAKQEKAGYNFDEVVKAAKQKKLKDISDHKIITK